MADITMPQLGETVTEGTITKWFKQVGDQVAEDEVLFEVSTDKVDSEVPSPSGGYVTEILVQVGEDGASNLVVLGGEDKVHESAALRCGFRGARTVAGRLARRRAQCSRI